MAKKLDKEKNELFVLFLEAGFIAVNQADGDSAVKLFKAANQIFPKNPLTEVGFGYLHLHRLELKQAIKCFRKVLKREPKNEMAKVFLGIALSWTGPKSLEGEKLLHESTKSRTKEIKTLSQNAIEFVDKFIKKAPTPVEGRTRK